MFSINRIYFGKIIIFFLTISLTSLIITLINLNSYYYYYFDYNIYIKRESPFKTDNLLISNRFSTIDDAKINKEKILLLDKHINASNHSFNFTKDDLLFEYKLIHESIINGSFRFKLSINGPTLAGYANRLYSMITSLVIALLSDSALVIRWQYIDKYIQEPFYKSFHDFTKENYTSSLFNADFQTEDLYRPKAKFAWSLNKDMNKLIQTQIALNAKRALYFDYDAFFFELCSNPVYFEKLFYTYKLFSEKTYRKASKIIQNMRNYTDEEKQDNILMIGFEVGGNLLNKIWLPKKELQFKIDSFVESSFKNFYIIGIQLRFRYIQDPQDTYSFVDCALQIERNYTLNNNNNNNNSNYEKKRKVKWFVTSDSPTILNRLALEYPQKIILTNDETMGKIGHVEKDANEFYQRTIIDVELLSKCDEIIISGGSTFGFVSAMKMLKLPFYINGHKNMKQCVKTGLSRPSITSEGFGIF